jgi:hypothetical protein
MDYQIQLEFTARGFEDYPTEEQIFELLTHIMSKCNCHERLPESSMERPEDLGGPHEEIFITNVDQLA